MFKKILIFFFLLPLVNCSAPGTALLGPVFTGATTKSVARASISFTSNQMVKNFKSTPNKSKKEVTEIVKSRPIFHFYN